MDEILDVPVPQTIKQFSEAEDGISSKIQRRTAEQVVSIPVLEIGGGARLPGVLSGTIFAAYLESRLSILTCR